MFIAKLAVMVLFPFMLIVVLAALELATVSPVQFKNFQPDAGVALMETTVPEAKEPAPVTEP